MAGTAQPLRLGALLGMRTSVSGGLAYLDETDVQYVSGHNIVRYDTETRQQRILAGTLEASSITAVADFAKQKACGGDCCEISRLTFILLLVCDRLTAFAEFTSEHAVMVTMYEWASKRRRRLVALEHGRSPVTHMCFSCDGRHLVIQTGAPEWILHYVAWEKGVSGKVAASLRNVAPVTKSGSPHRGPPRRPCAYRHLGSRLRAPVPLPGRRSQGCAHQSQA